MDRVRADPACRLMQSAGQHGMSSAFPELRHHASIITDTAPDPFGAVVVPGTWIFPLARDLSAPELRSTVEESSRCPPSVASSHGGTPPCFQSRMFSPSFATNRSARPRVRGEHISIVRSQQARRNPLRVWGAKRVSGSDDGRSTGHRLALSVWGRMVAGTRDARRKGALGTHVPASIVPAEWKRYVNYNRIFAQVTASKGIADGAPAPCGGRCRVFPRTQADCVPVIRQRGSRAQ